MRSVARQMYPLVGQSRFQSLLRGYMVGRTPHFVLHAVRLDGGVGAASAACYLGMVIPRRWARRAVTRNTIKRQIRALLPVAVPESAGAVVLVVRLRASFSSGEFVSATSRPLRQAIRAELIQLFQAVCWSQLAVWDVVAMQAFSARKGHGLPDPEVAGVASDAARQHGKTGTAAPRLNGSGPGHAP